MAKYIIETDESAEEWVASTFVSDESSIFDFLMEKDIEPLRNDLDLFTLSGHDRVVEVAQTLRTMKARQ